MDIQHQILEKIKAYDTIMLFRHSRVDGDCVGATKGMKALIQASFPDKKVLIVDDEHSDYLAFLGEDDAPFADDAVSHTHLRAHEEERSSACEMVADFYDKCRDELTLTKDAALYLYTGMVTDSGRFRFSCVSGDTMRLAAMLLDTGIDTEWLFANLYSVECWLAFIESPDGSTRVRLRSRFLTINQVAEKYHGGGHACASGATVYSTDEAAALIADADEAVREYKAAHENWL